MTPCASIGDEFEAAGGAAPPFETVTLASPRYPSRLRRIHGPPSMLYVRGTLPEDGEEPAVAIVGSRRATASGLEVCRRLAHDLAAMGMVIVSGMARGIDAAAHRGALAAGGRTIAVLGCGLDVAYPPEHADLAGAIAQHGCLITEFAPATPPLPWQFPRRNRIIAGLALGVVVVEGGAKSGALITAQCALEEGREVMAVPGNVLNPLSRGPHGLIREGAALVESAGDVLEVLGLTPLAMALPGRDGSGRAEHAEQVGGTDAFVLAAVGADPVHIDEVTIATGLPPAQVAAVLMELEIRGLVRQIPGKLFIRANHG